MSFAFPCSCILSAPIKTFLFFSLLLTVPRPAWSDTDFDGDGIDDTVTVTASATELSWSSVPTLAGAAPLSVRFGEPGNVALVASWTEPGSAEICAVRRGRRALVWRTVNTSGVIEEARHGKPGEYVLGGADTDGNGIADGVSVQQLGKRYRWRVRPNLLSGSPGEPFRFKFGTVGGRLLYLNPQGAGDWVGHTGTRGTRKKAKNKKSAIYLINPNNGDRIIIRGLPRSLMTGTRPRPFPIAQEDGVDAIGIAEVQGDATRIQVYSIEGTLLVEMATGLGTVLAGEFDSSQPGEEVRVLTGTESITLNPFTGDPKRPDKKALVLAGTPVPAYTVVQLVVPTPTATAVPPTPTATPSATPTR